jgi:TRAP-type C4-dicarboxylate transport system substrate-binding protein
LKKYNSLPDDLKDILQHCVEVFEGVDTVRILQRKDKAWEEMQEAGVSEIFLPSDEAETYVKTAYEATWETIIKEDPEYGPKLKELVSKPAKK